MADLKELEAVPQQAGPDLSAVALNASTEEIHRLEDEVKSLLKQLQESMPRYQDYLTLLNKREQLVGRIGAMHTKLSSFDMLAAANARKEPVSILLRATEPTVPIRPNRAMMIALFVGLGLALGAALVWMLEHIDHSVKLPEHLSAGLTLPLLGVIPRIRRTSNVHRGGHLWTPGAPGSLEADAYRNLRASLLGISGPRGPSRRFW